MDADDFRMCSVCGREAPRFDSPEIGNWVGGDSAYLQGDDDPDPLMLEELVCPECLAAQPVPEA